MVQRSLFCSKRWLVLKPLISTLLGWFGLTADAGDAAPSAEQSSIAPTPRRTSCCEASALWSFLAGRRALLTSCLTPNGASIPPCAESSLTQLRPTDLRQK